MSHFLAMAAGRNVDVGSYFNGPSQRAILDYEWPGNVREIAMVARRAHVDLMARGTVDMRLERDGDKALVLTGPGEAAEPGLEHDYVMEGYDAAERSRILLALEANGDNRILAAKSLGIGRSTLYRRMVKLGIPRRRI
jgi:DNA-binding NtrC family response regulator